MAYGNRVMINCTTGKKTEVPFTAEEAKQRDKERAIAAARNETPVISKIDELEARILKLEKG